MRIIVLIYLIALHPALYSQNLLPNGGFEDHHRCPGEYSQNPAEFYATQWRSASAGTPDYFNACSNGEADVPYNWAGVADAFEGNGYAGIYVWMNSGTNYREYLQIRLNKALVKDSVYDVSFHYKLSSYSKYSIDRIGAHLSEVELKLKDDRVVNFQPTIMVVKDSALTLETGLWEEAKFVYTARGDEQFLTIGNFADDRTTRAYKIQFRPTPQEMLANSSYYYIDDVVVVNKYRTQPLAQTEIRPFDVNETRSNTTYILKNINFQFNSFRLDPESFDELNKVAQYMQKHPDIRVQLFGHTDDVGSDNYNLKLSQARAKSVSEYLVSTGISSQRINYFGYGKARPLQDGNSDEVRALNRRVEIRFVGE